MVWAIVAAIDAMSRRLGGRGRRAGLAPYAAAMLPPSRRLAHFA